MNLGPSVVYFGVQNERTQDLDVLTISRNPYRRVEVFARSHGVSLRHRPLADWFNNQRASLSCFISVVQQLVKRRVYGRQVEESKPK